MAYEIIEIEGIGNQFAEQLNAVGVYTISDLLEQGASANGRLQLEKKTGIAAKNLLKWVGMSDLMRIDGVGKQFAELLKAAGVDTIKELKHRKAENLQATLEITNQDKKLTRAVPSFAQVKHWIEQAHDLQPLLTY